MLAGLLDRLQKTPSGPALALCPPEAVEEWARVAARIARGTGLQVSAAHAPGRLTRLIKSDAVHLAFASPETAYELIRRAALKLDAVSAILLLWPEAWSEGDLLGTLLQDVPKETQRIVVTEVAASLPVARYCWRAHGGRSAAGWPGSPPPVRSTPGMA